jgi:hypothetical protein
MKMRSFESTKEWNGQWIYTPQSEGRQPQDLVRGQSDPQNVEEPRPTATPIFLGPLQTVLTADAAAGQANLTVELTTRMFAGDVVELLCGVDDGAFQFRTTILLVNSTTSLTLAAVLPYFAPAGNILADITASATVNPADFPASNGNGPF